MDDSYKHPADEKKVRFRRTLGFKNKNKSWIIAITIISFIVSASLSAASSEVLSRARLFTAILVVLIIVIINIIFDIVGTAVTAADEAPFHAMASRKLYGARQAIKLIRNADKVSNFCNDVVGDICGVISGAAGTYIIINIVGQSADRETTFVGLIITACIASFTVGGKALGKAIAIENCNYIIYKVAVILKFIFGRISFIKFKSKRKKRLKER